MLCCLKALHFHQLLRTQIGILCIVKESISNYNYSALITSYRTLFTQEGVIEMIGFGRMSWLIEVFATKFLTRGAMRNVSIMEELMKERLAAFKLLAQ